MHALLSSGSTPPSTYAQVPLRTVRITEQRQSLQIKRISSLWVQKATEKLHRIHNHLICCSREMKNHMQSSLNIAKSLVSHIPADPRERIKIYFAFDATMKVQAIALTVFEEKGTEITFLATNPDNILPLESETSAVRGAGSSLVRHIAQDTLREMREDEAEIFLNPSETARIFYEKLGFEPSSSSHTMVLDARRIHNLVEMKPPFHTMQDDDSPLDETSFHG